MSEVKVSAGWVPPEASLLGVQMAVSSRVLTGSPLCVCLCPALSPYYNVENLTIIIWTACFSPVGGAEKAHLCTHLGTSGSRIFSKGAQFLEFSI